MTSPGGASEPASLEAAVAEAQALFLAADYSGCLTTVRDNFGRLWAANQWSLLRRLAHIGIDAADRLADQEGKRDCQQILGAALAYGGDPINAARVLGAVEEEAAALGDNLRLAQVSAQLGQIAKGRGEFSEANKRLRTAVRLYGRVGDDRGLAGQAKALGDLGNLLDDQGASDDALTAYAEAASLLEGLPPSLAAAIIWDNISFVHARTDNTESALSATAAAMRIRRALQDWIGVARGSWFIARLHWSRGDRDQAKGAAELALEGLKDQDSLAAREISGFLEVIQTEMAFERFLDARSLARRAALLDESPLLLTEVHVDWLAARLASEAESEVQKELRQAQADLASLRARQQREEAVAAVDRWQSEAQERLGDQLSSDVTDVMSGVYDDDGYGRLQQSAEAVASGGLPRFACRMLVHAAGMAAARDHNEPAINCLNEALSVSCGADDAPLIAEFMGAWDQCCA